ncbi:MAG: hypothetical protein GZ088_13245 [Acidipila sp.]|nr:hypothetical protein [Acidipila sp.]
MPLLRAPLPEVHLRLQPKQAAFFDMVQEPGANWLAYGGSRGGGKSYALRAIMLKRRELYKATRGLILRRTFEDVWQNHLQPLFEQYPFMRPWYHTQHKELTLPNGSAIVFGSAEHLGDIYGFQGKQYMDIAVDEATKLTEEELVFLKTCNRSVGIPEDHCKMLLTMNPGGVGHAFIKRVFIDGNFRDHERAGDYRFLQAYAWDNVGWAQKSLAEEGLTVDDYYALTSDQRFDYFISKTAYGRSLNSLSSALRPGHLLGLWDELAGQYFDIFDPSRHTARVEDLGLNPYLPRWISIDWGFQHPAAIHWHAQDGKRTFTYREWVVNHLSPRALAHEIAEKSAKETIDAVYLGPDAFARRTDEATIADQLGNVFAGRGIPRPAPADNDRIGGWMLLYDLLENNEWVIADNCRKLIEVLPTLVRKVGGEEDIQKVEGDDAADSARYGLKTRHSPRTPPVEARIAQRMEQVVAQDPTVRAIYARKFESEERKKHRPVMLRR